jgi:hypothetical protein
MVEGVEATNSTLSDEDGPPDTDAVIVATPTVVEIMLTVALPETVVALVLSRVPRDVANNTVVPSGAGPPEAK